MKGIITIIAVIATIFVVPSYLISKNNAIGSVFVDGKQMAFNDFMSHIDKQAENRTTIQLSQLTETNYDSELRLTVVDIEEDYTQKGYLLKGSIGREVVHVYFPNSEENKEKINKCLSFKRGDKPTVEGKLSISYCVGNEIELKMQNPSIK